MDSFTLSSLSSSIQSAPTPPLTPSASSPATGTMWQTQIQLHAAVPTLQMPRKRLKTVLNARNNVEFLKLENRLSLSSPSNRLARVNPTNLKNFFGSSIQSPTTMQMHQNANQPLWCYHSDLTNSNVIGSPQFRVDAFSKQSQSFIERTSMASFSSDLPSATSVAMEPSIFSGWGSPDGKLDWSIRGFQNRSSTSTMASALNVDDPDVFLRHESWVNSLVKDAPTMEFDQYCFEDQLKCHNPDAVLSLLEQLYMEHEQMVVSI